MSMKLNFINQTQESTYEHEVLIRRAFSHIDHHYIVNIIFVTQEGIQTLNRDFRQIDRVTDVISFALHDSQDLKSMAPLELGDIFICVDKAKEQASDYGHSLMREMAFLAVHGLLHLLGYDHQTEEEEKLMIQMQEQILNHHNITRE